MNLHFTRGDKAEAIDIMREAARWLCDAGKPLWDAEDLSNERLSGPPDEFVVMWDGEESVAAMTLCYEDPFFWPGVPPNESGFIHKLSIKRKYAGKGLAALLVAHARQICAEKGIEYLRLDCDAHRESLLAFYKACGFSLTQVKTLHTAKWGQIDLALFEMKCC